MTDQTEMTAARIVCVGRTELVNNKLGDLFILESELDGKSLRSLHEEASAFLSDRSVIGGVYKATAVLEGTKIRRLGTRNYVGRLDRPELDAASAAARASEDADRARKAEEKARKSPLIPRAAAELARIVAAAPYSTRENVLAGLMAEVRVVVRKLDEAKRK